MSANQITLGDVTITRIWEYYGSVEMTSETFFPESSPHTWKKHSSWLEPHFVAPETRIVNSAIQTWLLRSEGRNILIDTGVGNHKERPYSPVWSRLDTGFLDNLAGAGVRPEDVDVVVNTHLHVDHVGWNTYLDGRTWVPTFPNATYLIPKADFDFWNPVNEHKPVLGRGNQNVFEDSVAPVHEAGLTTLWEDEYTDRRQPAAGPRAGAHAGVLGCSPSNRAPTARCSSATCCTTPCRSWNRTSTVASARTRPRRAPPAARSSAGPQTGAPWSSPRTWAGRAPPRCVREGSGFAIKGWAPFASYAETAKDAR